MGRGGCHHIHEKAEWQVYRSCRGGKALATKGEAEYTAELAFAIAISSSWWAARVGKAKLNLKPLIKVSITGSRKGWPEADREIARKKAMPVIAVRLGL